MHRDVAARNRGIPLEVGRTGIEGKDSEWSLDFARCACFSRKDTTSAEGFLDCVRLRRTPLGGCDFFDFPRTETLKTMVLYATKSSNRNKVTASRDDTAGGWAVQEGLKVPFGKGLRVKKTKVGGRSIFVGD